MADGIESHIIYPSRGPRFGLLQVIRGGPPVGEDFGMMRHGSLEKRLKHGGHRPPQRPKEPRFRLLRRILRLLRRGGD